MSQRIFLGGFKWTEYNSDFNKDFQGKYNEDSDEGYFLEVDVQYPEKLHDIHNDLEFSHERIKVEKVVANLHDKKAYLFHIINLKQALYHGLVLKKVHRVIKLNQRTWLKQYIYMNRAKRESKE